MHPVHEYLKALRDIRLSGGGVRETSYYPVLTKLLDAAGDDLKPTVRCITTLRNTGAGIPDGGFFTREQFPRATASEPDEGQVPSRGALEVKGLDENVFEIAKSEQVATYLARYGQVLVTNLRDFVLVGSDHTGQRRILESFEIAPNLDAFLEALRDPKKTAATRGEPLLEYLKRVLLHPAPLADPKDLAWFLASYAKEARARVEDSALPALSTLRESLEGSLGITFEGDRGEHFFRSTLVQTLFYGVFSGWVLWSRQGGEGRFLWRETAWNLRVPMIRALFHQVADPERLERLGLVEVLDWAAEALNRVDRAAFFTRFREEHAVQYFYEPFLEAFDPELRKQLGVWYTPPEVVKYMVAKVDHALRTELEIPDGLADPRVVVLDPCCGTGAYLVEVLHHIGRTLREKGDDALIASDLKKAAMQRVYGFDIMPAPFVVAHLQLGLVLQEMGVPFGEDERAGIYLTNALTGWVPPKDPKDQLQIALPELAEERDQADHVKRDEPILVILGNPPYSGYAGMAIGEERDLTEAYRETVRAPKPQGQGLNDLYVRFFRMAERKITEMAPQKGVVCFISNYSWLDGLSFTGMRERFIDRFDRIDIDSLNGDKYRTGKTTPEGDPDPSIFSTEYNREGIQVGTAIATLVRRERHEVTTGVRYRDLWGRRKLDVLLGDAGSVTDVDYEVIEPREQIGFPVIPRVVAEGYLEWPRIIGLFPESHPGIKTSRDEFLVDIDRGPLEARLEAYFDPSIGDEEIARRFPPVMAVRNRFSGPDVRRELLGRADQKGRILKYYYRPFDVRWLYWDPDTKLLDEKRAEYLPHVFDGNIWIVSQQRPRRGWQPAQTTTVAACLDVMDRSASMLPLALAASHPADLFDQLHDDDVRRIDETRRYNLSDEAVDYLQSIGSVTDDAPHLFHHALAVMHAPTYRDENAGALKQDWPRIPLPASHDLLVSSGDLGLRLAALLNPETDVPGVTSGTIDPELRAIGPVKKVGDGALDPGAGDLEVSARWGYAGAGSATMPGPGRYEERDYTDNERRAIADSFAGLDSPLALLGRRCVDVYLNDGAYWSCIPINVWEYTLGGYQVIKKWLSYREVDLLGRSLSPDEARHVTEVARRIASILLMSGELDRSYDAVKASAVELSSS